MMNFMDTQRFSRFTSAHQTAILRYSEAPEVEPLDFPIYNYTRPGVIFNALNRGQEDSEAISMASMQSLVKEDLDDKRLLGKEVDFKFYVYYDFYGKDNYNFHKPNMYGFNQGSLFLTLYVEWLVLLNIFLFQ